MQKVISAIRTQIKLEEARINQREMMIANKSDVLFGDQLPNTNPEYLKELKEVLNLLEYRSEPLEKWNIKADDSVALPAYLGPLFYTVKDVLNSDCLVLECENRTTLKLVEIAEKFFHDCKPSR